MPDVHFFGCRGKCYSPTTRHSLGTREPAYSAVPIHEPADLAGEICDAVIGASTDRPNRQWEVGDGGHPEERHDI